MLTLLKAHIGTIVVLLILVVIVAFIIKSIIKDKRQAKALAAVTADTVRQAVFIKTNFS